MLLSENRVLWGAVASLKTLDCRVPTLLKDVKDARTLSPPKEAPGPNIEVVRCALITPVQYTQDAFLLEACVSSDGSYAFDFVCASLQTPARRYFCFLVPFRRMIGGVLSRVASSLRGKGCLWHRLDILDTVNLFRGRDLTPSGSVLCGLDLHLMAGREQEVIFIGMNPAQSRVFEVVTSEAENFTLSPISATFCVGGSVLEGDQDSASYFTIDRNGIVNVSVKSSLNYLGHMHRLLEDFERSQTLKDSADRPVYRSRNAHKAAILASISAR